MAAELSTRVADNPEEHRYELYVGDDRAGMIEYRSEPRVLALIHTEVDSRFEGRGLASRLVAAALDDLRSRGLRLVPVCPFVRAYLRRHPENRDLLRGAEVG